MPTLKQLTCNVEWSASGPNLPLQEYRTAYSDGLVETYIAIPPVPTPFSIRLKSDGYIAPGLSMFVYIDGQYQCNRGRNKLKIPTGTTLRQQTNVDFIVRQKEEPVPGGGFIGRQWMFGGLGVPIGGDAQFGAFMPQAEYMGTIEVVVLRSAELQRAKAPDPTPSEKHPQAFAFGPGRSSTPVTASGSVSDFGALFDGSSDIDERQSPVMPFGGDMAWDEDYYKGDWAGAPQADYQQDSASKKKGYSSRSTSQGLASNAGVTPAIIINVNQPAAPSPPHWAAQEPQPWNASKVSIADSWASTPAPGSVHESHAAKSRSRASDNAWQTWIQDTGKPKSSSPQPNWNKSASGNHQNSPRQSSSSSGNDSKGRGGNGGDWSGNNNQRGGSSSSNKGRNSRAQSVPGGWNSAHQNQQLNNNGGGWDNTGHNVSSGHTPQNAGQDGNNGWNDDANNNSSDQNNNTGWGASENGHWNTDQSGGNQGNWDSVGANENQGGNSGWSSGDNNANNWDSGQNDQPGWNSNDNQNGGDWNPDQNDDQGNIDWGNDNQNGGNWNNDQNNSQGNTGWDTENNNQGLKDGWNNANVGAQESQAANGQNWNTSGDNQGAWSQGGQVNGSGLATAGGIDPAKPRSRRASFGKAATASKLSKKASVNAAAQKMGWGPSSANGAQKPPGAWPDNPPMALGAFQNGVASTSRPYHLAFDVTGNPRLPDMQIVAPAPAPPPPPPQPLGQTNNSYQVHSGEPTLYQHKIASPKYIDTHDKPYAIFIFRYRTKAVLEQMLNTTIPDSEDVEKAKLAKLSKEELIAEVIKIKSRNTSKANTSSSSSPSSSATTLPASLNNFPPVANNNNNNNSDANGPPATGFGAALTDKLAAVAAQNRNSGSGSGSGSVKKNNNNNPPAAWNAAPPGSPMPKKNAPSSPSCWPVQNNNTNNNTNNSWPPAYNPSNPSNNNQNNNNNSWPTQHNVTNGAGAGGAHVETWLHQTTPAGAGAGASASASGGHEPWGGGGGNGAGAGAGSSSSSRGKGKGKGNENGSGNYNSNGNAWMNQGQSTKKEEEEEEEVAW